MPDAALPPWMQTNPLAPVPLFLQGYSQGASVGASQRRAEEEAYNRQLQDAAIRERNDILREAKQIQAQEFAQSLKLKQDAAQQAAREAAIQLEGQQALEKDLQSGMSFQEAFPRHATKILYKHPQSLTEVLHQLNPRGAQYGEPTTVTLAGQEFAHIPGSASLTPIRNTELPEGGIQAVAITNPDTGEITYGRPGPQGTVIPLPRGESKTATLRALRKEKRDLEKAKASAALIGQDTSVMDADIASVQAEMDQLMQKAPSNRAKGELVKVSTKEEYDKLPAGTDYIAPDGSIRHKK